MAASKEFSSLKTIKERHIANRSMSQQLFSEMQEKGLEISVDTLNGSVCVYENFLYFRLAKLPSVLYQDVECVHKVDESRCCR